MVICAPSHAGGMGGRSRNITTELGYIWDDYNINHQNYNNDGTLEAAVSLQHANNNYNSNSNDHNNNSRTDPNHHGHHRQSNRSRSRAQGNRWAESKAMRLFRAQSQRFNHGTQEYIKRNRPSSREIIAMTNQESRKALHRRNNSQLAVTATKLAQAEGSAS
jgi:hypothetical protein